MSTATCTSSNNNNNNNDTHTHASRSPAVPIPVTSKGLPGAPHTHTARLTCTFPHTPSALRAPLVLPRCQRPSRCSTFTPSALRAPLVLPRCQRPSRCSTSALRAPLVLPRCQRPSRCPTLAPSALRAPLVLPRCQRPSRCSKHTHTHSTPTCNFSFTPLFVERGGVGLGISSNPDTRARVSSRHSRCSGACLCFVLACLDV
jgi:hypothetical protein